VTGLTYLNLIFIENVKVNLTSIEFTMQIYLSFDPTEGVKISNDKITSALQSALTTCANIFSSAILLKGKLSDSLIEIEISQYRKTTTPSLNTETKTTSSILMNNIIPTISQSEHNHTDPRSIITSKNDPTSILTDTEIPSTHTASNSRLIDSTTFVNTVTRRNTTYFFNIHSTTFIHKVSIYTQSFIIVVIYRGITKEICY
jgi:hypothetical protein